MRRGTIIKLAVFNICFAALEIFLFSPIGLDIGENKIASLFVIALSVGSFLGVNYWLLNNKPLAERSESLGSIQDCKDVLKSWKGKRPSFATQLDEAMKQLDLFYQKRTALHSLLGDQVREPGNPYVSICDDVQESLFANMKRIANRMVIVDPKDNSQWQMHRRYVLGILKQNEVMISQFENLLIEISQIGDTADTNSLQLETVTDALRELREGSQEKKQDQMQEFQDSTEPEDEQAMMQSFGKD